MGVIIIGTRAYGQVDDHAGECAQTAFLHFDFIPLLPRASAWVTRTAAGEYVEPIRLHGKSIAAVYLRFWGAIGVVAAAMTVPGMLGLALSGALAAASVWAWTWRSLRGDRALRRSDYNLVAFGTRCEPARMLPAQRDALIAQLTARWTALDTGRSPNEVARYGTDSVEEAALAYGLLRLAAAKRGRAGADDRAAADRLLDGTYAPAPAEEGPYRGTAPATARDHRAAIIAQALTLRPVASPRGSRRWFQRPRIQLIGLAFVSTLAVASLGWLWQGIAGFPTLTAAELTTALDTPRLVEIDLDEVVDAGWLQLRSSRRGTATVGRIVFGRLGDRALPIAIAQGDDLPRGTVSGWLGRIDGVRGEAWTDRIYQDPSLARATYDYYLDARDSLGERRIRLVVGGGFLGIAVVGWIAWLGAWRRRRRA